MYKLRDTAQQPEGSCK